eukprot:232833-Chlamydomonas_euryale.AAC.1
MLSTSNAACTRLASPDHHRASGSMAPPTFFSLLHILRLTLTLLTLSYTRSSHSSHTHTNKTLAQASETPLKGVLGIRVQPRVQPRPENLKTGSPFHTYLVPPVHHRARRYELPLHDLLRRRGKRAEAARTRRRCCAAAAARRCAPRKAPWRRERRGGR